MTIRIYCVALLFVGLGLFQTQAQEVQAEKSHELESLNNISYIGDAIYNPETGGMDVVYAETHSWSSQFVTYTFDDKLNYVTESMETLSFLDDIDMLLSKYPWFEYHGDEYQETYLNMQRTWGGEIEVRRETYTFKWFILNYYVENIDVKKVRISGLDGEKLYLYDYVSNFETDEIIMLVGLKGKNYQHAREFQLVKVSADNEVEMLDKISFDYNVAIGFNQVITTQAPSLAEETQEGLKNIHGGKWTLAFAPVASILGKKFQGDNPGAYRLVTVAESGQIETSFDIDVPSSGWVIEDYSITEDGSEIFFYGPASSGKYINKLAPVISPLSRREEIKEVKYKEFQVMKVVNGELAWVKSTNLDEFKAKAVAPDGQKGKAPTYNGKKFIRTGTFIAPNGELLISGQEFDKKTQDNVVTYKYEDLIMFHFNADGTLKAQYGVKRQNNNKHAEANITPQYLYSNEGDTELYWVYGEIDGYRAGLGIFRKGKLLFYPAVAKINISTGTVGSFMYPGTNEKGKQMYYTNPDFPQKYIPESNMLLFFGEDKKGKEVWLCKMKLD